MPLVCLWKTSTMSILKRGMIFITFFGCCFAIALAAAAMGTKFWLESDAIQRRINPDKTLEVRPNSTGHVNFGLFKGRKSLNVGFGTRVHPFDGEYRGGETTTPLAARSVCPAAVDSCWR